MAVLINLHPQAQAHRSQNVLDLVERLATKVLGLEHLALGLLHQVADRLDVGVLEAVV